MFVRSYYYGLRAKLRICTDTITVFNRVVCVEIALIMQYFHSHHKRRAHGLLHAIHFGFSGGLLFAALTVFVVGLYFPAILVFAGSGNAPFSTSSAWNTALPKYAPAHANNAALIAALQSQVQSYGAQVDITDSAPVYVVDSGAPTVSVTPWGCNGAADNSLAGALSAVPIPFYAQPSTGPQGRMIIYQPTTGAVWELGGAYKSGDQWFACHGGYMADTSVSTGSFTGSHGVTDSALSLLAGQISLADIGRGRIDHAIGLGLPQVSTATSWPAVRGGSGGSLPMGSRLQLDPSLNVDSLGLSNYGKMVAKAAQQYGFIVWDQTRQVTISGDNPLALTARGASNPYSSTSLAGFPWQSVRVLPVNYGISGHLPQIPAFSLSQASVSKDDKVTITWAANNISSCTIPGVGAVGPSGSVLSAPLLASSNITIACSGPAGQISRSLPVRVAADPPDSTKVPPSALTIAQPVSGRSHIISDLEDPTVLAAVYKVVYYHDQNVLQSTTASPFTLDTEGLADGPYEIKAQLYFRDGTTTEQQTKIMIRNNPLSLIARVSAPPNVTPQDQRMIIAIGIVGCLLIMAGASYFGWRRGYLVHN